MGPAIGRSIIESHGGRLWATENDGRGQRFHFTLPIAAEEVKVAATNMIRCPSDRLMMIPSELWFKASGCLAQSQRASLVRAAEKR